MMRYGVVRIESLHFRVGSLTQLAGQHKRGNACEVGLIREHLEIEHKLDVLFERLRYSERSRHGSLGRNLLSSGLGKTPFDFANVFKIIVQRIAIRRAQTHVEPLGLLGHRVENAAILLDSGEPLLACAAVAE